MLAKDLLNKSIIEIRCLIFEYKYNGNIPLEDVIVELRLNSGEIINYPLHPNAQLEKKQILIQC